MRDRRGALRTRERTLAYLSAFLHGRQLVRATKQVLRRHRVPRGTARVLRTAHLVLRRYVRVSPEAAAHALVTEAHLPVETAAGIAGIAPERLYLLLAHRGTVRSGRSMARVGERRRGLLWPGVAAVWLAVLALAVLPADGVARGPVTLLAQPDQQVSLSAVAVTQPDLVQPGSHLRVTVAVLNGGPDDATDVNVRVRTSDGVTPVADSGGVSISGADGTTTGELDAARLFSEEGANVGRIPAAATAEVVAALEVDDAAPDGTELGVVARISVPGFGELEATRASSTVRRRPELTVDLTVSPDGPVTPGDRLTWSVRVANSGTVPATSVSVHGEVPDGLRYLDGTALVDGRAPVERTDGAVGLTVGEIAPGAVRTASYQTLVKPGAAGDVLEHRVRATYQGADDPARSDPVTVEVGMAGQLADTGVRMIPAAVAGLALLLGGAILLRRTGARST